MATEADEARKAVRQRLFDISLNHIRAQGAPSMNGTRCAYRSVSGRRCAAEPFILAYDYEMEAKSWRSLCFRFRDKVDQNAYENIGLVSMLQNAHDEAAVSFSATEDQEPFMAGYERRMKLVAKQFDLVYREPSE